MRYIFLIYGRELREGETSQVDIARLEERHWAVMDAAQRKGVLHAAQPLKNTSTATTVRLQGDKPLVTDGPFAETREQLAGYYILECANLDEAIEWAAKIPSECKGGPGCIEIRPLDELPMRS